MTPRAGVKTTLAIETRLPGLPDPKRGPHFFYVPNPAVTPPIALSEITLSLRFPFPNAAQTELLVPFQLFGPNEDPGIGRKRGKSILKGIGSNKLERH